MGVEKWTQKWCQNLTPKMGVQKWHPKGGPISCSRRNQSFIFILTIFWVPFLDPILGAIFGPPFWGSNSGTIFGSIFQPPFWGPKHGAKFAKIFAAKAHLHSNFFQQTCITKCMCSHCLARCSSEHNLILHLAKTRKITKRFGLPQMLHMSKMDYSLRI